MESLTSDAVAMNAPNRNTIDESASVAFIISHIIKAGEEQRYEDWLTDILRAVSSSPGYLGREIFRPAHGSLTALLTFVIMPHYTRLVKRWLYEVSK